MRLFRDPCPPEEMSNTCAGAGGSWGEHTGPGGWRARCKDRRCKHPVLSAGESISSSFPSCSPACRHQVGAVPSRMRRGLLPCVKVSSYYWKQLLMTLRFWKCAMVFFKANTVVSDTITASFQRYRFVTGWTGCISWQWSVLLHCANTLWNLIPHT